MKKLLLFALAALLAAPSFAQSEEMPSLYTSESGTFSINAVSHLGWGYGFVESEAFVPKGSGEFFLNVFRFNLMPADILSLSLGLDLKWTYVGSNTSYFFLDGDQKVQVLDFSELSSEKQKEKTRSALNDFALTVPVVAALHFNDFQIGGGAEANFNLAGDTYYRYAHENVRATIEESKAKLNTFTYNFVGFVGYKSFNVFGKFYPKNSRFLAEGSVPFNYWTLGIALSL